MLKCELLKEESGRNNKWGQTERSMVFLAFFWISCTWGHSHACEDSNVKRKSPQMYSIFTITQLNFKLWTLNQVNEFVRVRKLHVFL